MTSLMTNTAAMTALKTLQMTNSALDDTQNRISTGYRVADAKDNAAYWSIATTMRSDNASMSAVKDSLGIGAATVDTAYTALNSTKDVLNEIKAKLTTATQEGVDKSKVQDEIGQLQEQLKSIAASASFSGQNWLSVNSSVTGYNSVKSMVANFSRDDKGALSLGTIGVDTSRIALFDANADAKGIMSEGTGNTSTGGVADATNNVATTGGVPTTAATQSYDGTFAAATFSDAADQVAFTFNIDGASKTVTILGSDVTAANGVATDGTIASVDELVSVFNAKNTTDNSFVAYKDASNKFAIKTTEPGAAKSVQLMSVTGTDDATNADAKVASAFDLAVIDNTVIANGKDTGATATMATAFAGPLTIDADDTISFDIALDGNAAKTVKIDQATVNAALSDATATPPVEVTDGKIATADDYAKVLNYAFANASGGAIGAAAGVDGSGNILIGSTTTTSGSEVTISNAKADSGTGVDGIDITKDGITTDDIKRYISVVDTALGKVTAGASTLGSVQNRIDMQTNFVSALMDTIDKGVGTLVDADMTEESTKLKALQTQQQLGVQALSIANSSSQSLLSLFR